ncbi:MAG: ester cyclase [Halobacteriales archaeon]|nr:ester cyclase [Halobacteriales archaeon]
MLIFMAMKSMTSNKEIVRKEIERVWQNQDLSFADEYVAEDYVLHDPTQPEPIRGRAGYKEYVRMMSEAFPDMEVTDYDMIAEDDTVAVRYNWRATHDGELMGIEPTGIELTGSGMVFVRFADGKMQEAWTIDDGLGVLEQLGVFEPPTASA